METQQKRNTQIICKINKQITEYEIKKLIDNLDKSGGKEAPEYTERRRTCKGEDQQPQGIRNQKPEAKNQEAGTWDQKPGIKNQKPGTRNQEPGIRNRE